MDHRCVATVQWYGTVSVGAFQVTNGSYRTRHYTGWTRALLYLVGRALSMWGPYCRNLFHPQERHVRCHCRWAARTSTSAARQISAHELGRSVGAPPDRPTHVSGRYLRGSSFGKRRGPVRKGSPTRCLFHDPSFFEKACTARAA